MRTVWKWTFIIRDHVAVEMPKGAKILSVQMQGNTPCFWAEVDPKEEKEVRHFEIYGTGHMLCDTPKKYIGTFQVSNGTLVFHVYERVVS